MKEEHRLYVRLKNQKKELNSTYYNNSEKEIYKKRIKLLKKLLYKNISPSEYATLQSILMNDTPENRNYSPINPKLARVIVLKNNLKKKIKVF